MERKLIRNCLMPLLSVKCLGYPSTNSSVYHLLQTPAQSFEKKVHEMELQNHELEMKLSETTGELNVSKSEFSHQKEKADMLQTQLKARQPVIYTLLCLCATMAFSLLFYIILDINAPAVGFIQHGKISVVAWIVIAMISVSTVAISWSIIKVIQKK